MTTTTRDDDGRRRETTRILIIDGRSVALGQAHPVTPSPWRDPAFTPNKLTVVRRVCAAMGAACVALTAVSVWFVPAGLVCATGWLLCLYGEI